MQELENLIKHAIGYYMEDKVTVTDTLSNALSGITPTNGTATGTQTAANRGIDYVEMEVHNSTSNANVKDYHVEFEPGTWASNPGSGVIFTGISLPSEWDTYFPTTVSSNAGNVKQDVTFSIKGTTTKGGTVDVPIYESANAAWSTGQS